MIYFQREKPNTLPLDINKHWGNPSGEISRSSLTFTSKQYLSRTPQLCSQSSDRNVKSAQGDEFTPMKQN